MSQERLVAEIPTDLKELVDADSRTNKEVVEAALWREFGGKRKGVIDRRIEEKKRRISMIESEKNERKREMEAEKQELEALEKQRENVKSERQMKMEDVLQRSKSVPADPSHPFIQKQAGELDMQPEDLAREIADYHNKEYDPMNDDDDLRSL